MYRFDLSEYHIWYHDAVRPACPCEWNRIKISPHKNSFFYFFGNKFFIFSDDLVLEMVICTTFNYTSIGIFILLLSTQKNIKVIDFFLKLVKFLWVFPRVKSQFFTHGRTYSCYGNLVDTYFRSLCDRHVQHRRFLSIKKVTPLEFELVGENNITITYHH